MEVAFQLCHPNGLSSKKQVAQALDLARGSLYLKRKQAQKDTQVAVAIEAWHEKDETMGHRKLGALLHMGKNRVPGETRDEEICHDSAKKTEKICLSGESQQHSASCAA